MKLLYTAFLLSAALFIMAPVSAGPGHEHDHGHSHGPITSDAAAEKAAHKVEKLAKAGKIDASWAKLTASSVEKKTFSKGPEWVVIFKNNQVSDTTKQTLYLFYTLDGHYIAANYTGN